MFAALHLLRHLWRVRRASTVGVRPDALHASEARASRVQGELRRATTTENERNWRMKRILLPRVFDVLLQVDAETDAKMRESTPQKPEG